MNGTTVGVRILSLVAVLWLAGCDMPRDPADTLERARGGVLRVGGAEAPPSLVRAADGSASGPEAEIVEGFARSIHARVEWHWGSADELLRRLEKRELDVVAGGLRAKTPWRTHVAFTQPWRKAGEEKHVIAVATGENGTLVALDRWIHANMQP